MGAYAGYISLAITIGGTVFAIINHKRIRSNCCGKEGTISLEVDNITPKPTVNT